MGIGKYFKIIKRYIDRRNPIEYARKIGVTVGNNSRFVSNPNWGSEPYLISIGDHCLLSGAVTFVTHDGATWVFRETEEYKDTYKFGKIKVGNNCFIGYGATILPNVEIGDNCIVAAGAIVNKSIPSGEVWGGGTRSLHYNDQGLCRQVFRKQIAI